MFESAFVDLHKYLIFRSHILMHSREINNANVNCVLLSYIYT